MAATSPPAATRRAASMPRRRRPAMSPTTAAISLLRATAASALRPRRRISGWKGTPPHPARCRTSAATSPPTATREPAYPPGRRTWVSWASQARAPAPPMACMDSPPAPPGTGWPPPTASLPAGRSCPWSPPAPPRSPSARPRWSPTSTRTCSTATTLLKWRIWPTTPVHRFAEHVHV